MNWLILFLVTAVASGCNARGLSEPRNRLHKAEAVQEALFPDEELETDYWINNAKDFVTQQLEKTLNTKKAKNIVFFIGDGMSIPTIAATRVYMGGEEKSVSFEKFPDIGMVKTYCVNRQTPDSASTATAYLTGVKGNYGTAGVNANVPRYNCAEGLRTEFHTPSIAKWAQDANKATGLVTNTRVTHASPSGVYAHTANRDWETDTKADAACPGLGVPDIAYQLMNNDVGQKLQVVMGGGRPYFRNESIIDEDGQTVGLRSDGKDLIDFWQTGEGQREYVWNRDQLLAVDASKTDYLLGLFATTHMFYHLETVEDNTEDVYPTLAEMTEKAIDVLSKNENGFFLFVEGGRIDMAHHSTYAKMAFDETEQFSQAVDMARKKLSEEDTLIVVSSDHSHTLQYSGYATRGAPITTTTGKATDGFSYNTISYANGRGFDKHFINGVRIDPETIDKTPIRSRYPGTSMLSSETHGADDVGVFASGPYSHLFTGTYEQHVLPHLMAYAACIGDGLTACDDS